MAAKPKFKKKAEKKGEIRFDKLKGITEKSPKDVGMDMGGLVMPKPNPFSPAPKPTFKAPGRNNKKK